MTGQIVFNMTLILLSDFIGYNPRSRKKALSRYRELSAIRHCYIKAQAYVQTHLYSLYLALW
jgi:hypothetical protein